MRFRAQTSAGAETYSLGCKFYLWWETMLSSRSASNAFLQFPFEKLWCSQIQSAPLQHEVQSRKSSSSFSSIEWQVASHPIATSYRVSTLSASNNLLYPNWMRNDGSLLSFVYASLSCLAFASYCSIAAPWCSMNWANGCQLAPSV